MSVHTVTHYNEIVKSQRLKEFSKYQKKKHLIKYKESSSTINEFLSESYRHEESMMYLKYWKKNTPTKNTISDKTILQKWKRNKYFLR